MTLERSGVVTSPCAVLIIHEIYSTASNCTGSPIRPVRLVPGPVTNRLNAPRGPGGTSSCCRFLLVLLCGEDLLSAGQRFVSSRSNNADIPFSPGGHIGKGVGIRGEPQLRAD